MNINKNEEKEIFINDVNENNKNLQQDLLLN